MDIRGKYQFKAQAYNHQTLGLNENASQAAAKVEKTEAAKEYTIDEILDSVEMGDVSILKQLNIPFTEFNDGSGYQKFSFKFNGVRYTVNVIENNQNDVTSEENNNIKTVKNDDGSYSTYEYDVDGNLLKSSDYDKDGRITQEYIYNDEESHSNKYYTYENGELIQVDETINYSNGNYTFITTDGNGNLKEEQKVIHNEYGGLTFDITQADGRRMLHITNNKMQSVNNVYYASNGEIEKTEEFSYNSYNPNIYTVTTKDNDGNVILQEMWENYTYTDEEGVTWYGSRLLDRVDYAEFNNRISGLQEYIDALKDSPNSNPDLINALEKQLEFVKATGTNASYEKTMLLQQQADVNIALSKLVVPTPPNTSDFIKSDGTVDEEAYREALNKYEFDCYNYDQDKRVLEEKLSIINNELHKLELEKEAKSSDIDKLEKNINVAKNIQQMLDSISNEKNNRVLVARLKSMLTDLARNVNSQTAILEKLSALEEEMKNQEFPTPPSLDDYKSIEYSFAIGPRTYTIKKLEQNSDGTYIARLNDGTCLICKPQFDENGNITKLTTLDKYGNNVHDFQLTMNSVFDEKAYTKAMNKYEYDMYKYDEKMNNINKQTANLANVLSNIEQQVYWLNFSSCSSVVENKISDCRKNGNYREAHVLEKKLNELRKEFANIQAQKRSLLDREKVLNNRLNSLVPPKVPSTNDYLNHNGTVNERAYKRVFERYEKQRSQFDRITARIKERLENIHNTLNTINSREIELQAEIEELAK